MPNIRKLDPTTSPMHHLGAELRRYREAAGLTQDQLGAKVYCTGSLIGQYETARKIPTRRFTMQLDEVLGTGGALLRLLEMALCFRVPLQDQQYADLEAEAAQAYFFEPNVVNGLLQTPDYARAVIGVLDKDSLDYRLAHRMDRQRVLLRENPLLTWVILGEAALHQAVGGPEVMWNQLAHLLTFRDQDWVNIQVLPYSAGAHVGFQGAFTLFRFEKGPDLAFNEDYEAGYLTANPQDVTARTLRYAHLQAAALSIQDSADLIAHVMEERYGSQP
ncbi:helix-turn-helix transcriptional regulator [Streptomyces sp. NBRC 110028]|uniref:helix-turn-helix domain-containing protein n=1 Tax=Streptomyces sp. NBRC 110028 TaxID=1621260 RepID=UPI0006E32C67|nr:helix-turn-helix transcriptional regulator [Streptomyces sp. NBRC 110028]